MSEKAYQELFQKLSKLKLDDALNVVSSLYASTLRPIIYEDPRLVLSSIASVIHFTSSGNKELAVKIANGVSRLVRKTDLSLAFEEDEEIIEEIKTEIAEEKESE